MITGMGWCWQWFLHLDVEDGYLHTKHTMLVADGLRELLPVIDRARSDRRVLRWRLHRGYYVAEPEPETCTGCGTQLRPGVMLGDAVPMRVWRCATCPGHSVWTCGCGHRTVWPPPGLDCRAVRGARPGFSYIANPRRGHR